MIFPVYARYDPQSQQWISKKFEQHLEALAESPSAQAQPIEKEGRLSKKKKGGVMKKWEDR